MQAGDLIRFNAFGYSGNYDYTRWTLYNAFGQVLGTPQSASYRDSANLRMESAGAVYLVFDYASYYGYSGGATFQIDRVNDEVTTPLLLNETVSGTLDPQTQKRSYSFTIDTPTTIYFDRLSGTAQNYSLRWTNFGPYGQTLDGYIYYSEGHVFKLQPGAYSFVIENQSFETLAYAFRLVEAGKHLSPVCGFYGDLTVVVGVIVVDIGTIDIPEAGLGELELETLRCA